MAFDFTSFSTVVQLYQDGARMMKKAVRSETPFTVEKISHRAGLDYGSARSKFLENHRKYAISKSCRKQLFGPNRIFVTVLLCFIKNCRAIQKVTILSDRYHTSR